MNVPCAGRGWQAQPNLRVVWLASVALHHLDDLASLECCPGRFENEGVILEEELEVPS